MLSAPQPAAAQASDATLSSLTLVNAVDLSPVNFTKDFSSDNRNYIAYVLNTVIGVKVTPTAFATGEGNAPTITVGLEGDDTPETVSSGSASRAIRIWSGRLNSISIQVVSSDGRATNFYDVSILHSNAVNFGSTFIRKQVFTAGAPVDLRPMQLPEASGGGDASETVYEAIGLPDGVRLGPNRALEGTPTEATESPMRVTYKATGANGSNATLTFTAEVRDAVAFDRNHLDPVSYTLGQTRASLDVQLPEASGGEGSLTYQLLRNTGGKGVTALGIRDRDGTPLTNFAGGVSFNTRTRKITGRPTETGRDAFTYYAIDANGGYAAIPFDITVAAAPKLPTIMDRTFAANTAIADDANALLPEASGGAQTLRKPGYYLSPLPQAISFDNRTRKLSGTPISSTAASTTVTYTVTDENEVSDSKTFIINVPGGTVAPASAPADFETYAISANTIALDWANVTGATAYVVQALPFFGSNWPSGSEESLPPGAWVTFYPTGADVGDGRMVRALLQGLASNAFYSVRVAAANSGGTGPFSAPETETTPVGGL